MTNWRGFGRKWLRSFRSTLSAITCNGWGRPQEILRYPECWAKWEVRRMFINALRTYKLSCVTVITTSHRTIIMFQHNSQAHACNGFEILWQNRSDSPLTVTDEQQSPRQCALPLCLRIPGAAVTYHHHNHPLSEHWRGAICSRPN